MQKVNIADRIFAIEISTVISIWKQRAAIDHATHHRHTTLTTRSWERVPWVRVASTAWAIGEIGIAANTLTQGPAKVDRVCGFVREHIDFLV